MAGWESESVRQRLGRGTSALNTYRQRPEVRASARCRCAEKGEEHKEPPGGVRHESDDHGLGWSRGGLTTKLYLAVEQGQRPLSLVIAAGQRGDSPQIQPALEDVRVPRLGGGRPRTRPDRVRADKVYSSRANRSYLRRRDVKCTIPEKKHQAAQRVKRVSRGGRPRKFDATDYRERHAVEYAINRAVATRYDKLAAATRRSCTSPASMSGCDHIRTKVQPGSPCGAVVVIAYFAETRPLVQPESRDVVALHLEIHVVCFVCTGPVGQRGEHIAGRAFSACLGKRGHTEYSRPAGVGDRAAHRDDIVPDNRTRAGTRPLHTIEHVPLGTRVTMIMPSVPDFEPCACRAVVQSNPQGACRRPLQDTRGRRHLQRHQAMTAVATLCQDRVKPFWTRSRADLEPRGRAVTGIELLRPNDPAHQFARPGITMWQHRSHPPGTAGGMAQPPAFNILNVLRRKSPGRSLL